MNVKFVRAHPLYLSIILAIVLVGLVPRATNIFALERVNAQGDDPSPPAEPVKLIFIHHSTGENWLADDYGNLGRALEANNYFVSDTNYGWGPNGIGDRTDIINWQEWFRSPDTPEIMATVYRESDPWDWDGWYYYNRTLPDPGGENEIVLFKSCFPNSALEGSPNDLPTQGSDFNVGNAKYIYNDLLNYFGTRPDKLFVVITAPPLQDPSLADNARAFNLWLINDWLAGYMGNNVAVWDFYNVLTGPNHHHRFENGQVEHVYETGANTLFYPSGDDHPSAAGSQKATEEFVSMLNVFYNRWKASAPAPQPVQPESAAPSDEQPSEVVVEPTASRISGVIDDFEGGPIAEAEYWVAFWDESTPTTITCSVDLSQFRNGAHSLLLDFNVAANSWATCELSYWQPQVIRAGEGLSFSLHANQPGLAFDVLVFGGTPDTRETFVYSVKTVPESITDWVTIEIPWSHFHRADWEADAGAPFQTPDQFTGVAFGFNGLETKNLEGTLWIDDLEIIDAAPTAPEAPSDAPQDQAPQTQDEKEPGSPLPCPGSVGLGSLILLGTVWIELQNRRPDRKQ
jgi:hypothetical protein